MSSKNFVTFFLICLGFYSCCYDKVIKTYVTTKNKRTHYRSVGKLKIESVDKKFNLVATGFAVTESLILTAGHFCFSILDNPQDFNWTEDIILYYINEDNEIDNTDGLTIEAANKEYDLCLIRRNNHALVPLEIKKDFFNVAIGEEVITIGAPMGFFPSLTKGSVINKGADFKGRLAVTIPVAQGNSGGPIIDQNGEVVGMVIAVIGSYHHITIATPSDLILEFLYDGE